MRTNLVRKMLLTLAVAGSFLLLAALPPARVQAAGLSKPVLVKKSCSFTNKKVCLTWKKVKGAQRYQIFRAKINPKTGKIGKWLKWTTTRKTSIKKKASGDYKYRIRAVRGKNISKWSKMIRIFAATGQIVKMNYVEPDVFFGVVLSEGRIEMRVLVNNKTKSPIAFLVSGSRIPIQSKIYAIDKSTGKVKKRWDAYVETNAAYGTVLAKQVNPGKKQYVDFYSYVTAEEWEAYKNCSFMITNSFYPNPEKEPMSTQMALASTKYAKDSSIAGK